MAHESALPTGPTRALYGLGDVVTKGAANLRHNPLMTLAGILTLSVTLIILGIAFFLNANLVRFLKTWKSRVQIVAFLEDAVTPEAGQALASQIKTWPNVSTVRWTSKEEAYQSFASEEQGKRLLEALGDNPLPASLEVAMKVGDREKVKGIAEKLKKLTGVSGVDYGEVWLESLYTGLTLARVVAVSLAVVITASSVIIVAYTVGTAAASRRQEMKILQYLGLPLSWVIAPLLGEGFWQGLIAASTASLILFLAFLGLHVRFPSLVVWSWQPVILIFVVGIGLGLAGSLFSARRALR